MADIDLRQANPYEWQSIGLPLLPFTGHFYGNNLSIRHLNIHTPNERYTGFFGLIGHRETDSDALSGLVQDLTIVDANVIGHDMTSILAGKNEGVITSCHVTGHAGGDAVVGGLVGWNTGEVLESSSTANVSGECSFDILIGHTGEILPSCWRGGGRSR